MFSHTTQGNNFDCVATYLEHDRLDFKTMWLHIQEGNDTHNFLPWLYMDITEAVALKVE